MTVLRKIMTASALVTILTSGSSCSVLGPKHGCPANGKSFGAERILSGEKPPKAKKFRA